MRTVFVNQVFGLPDIKRITTPTLVLGGVVTRDDAADFLRNRARNVLAGTNDMPWQHRDRAARALNIAARVLGV